MVGKRSPYCVQGPVRKTMNWFRAWLHTSTYEQKVFDSTDNSMRSTQCAHLENMSVFQ